VQEVLAEREFRIGRFYYLRESYAASVARLKTLADQYPLYSSADAALWMLGQSYEHQLLGVKQFHASTKEAAQSKERLQGELQRRVADAYSRIIKRYPLSAFADEAKVRLKALSFPVPTPTAEAIAQNKAEIESRTEMGMMGKAWDNFRSRPNMTAAARVGEPALEDQQPTNAPTVVRELSTAMVGDVGKSAATIQQVKPGDVKPNEATPRSDANSSDNKPDAGAANPDTGAAKSESANTGAAKSESAKSAEQGTDASAEPAAKSSEQAGGDLTAQPSGDQSGISTLQVTNPSDGNLHTEQADKPVKPAEPPAQVNDARTDSSSKPDVTQQDNTNGSGDQQSSSKKKKKKKLGIF
jgi:outer membrane protein assembly factor BamD